MVTVGAAAATETARRGAAACSGLRGCDQPGGLQAHHGLGGGVQVAELLVKQLHSLARELGKDVPMDVSAEPGEAAGRRRESEGWALRAMAPGLCDLPWREVWQMARLVGRG